MQHKNRQLFLERLLDTMASNCDEVVVANIRTALEERLDGLLNDFLLESQPILASNVTILLADLRGFTVIAENYPPAIVIDLLNRFFSVMSAVVIAHKGVVDKFMGDSVMALFGVPVRSKDDLMQALNCAVRMQQAMAEINRVNEILGVPHIYAGIGMNTGQVMAGSFGSHLHSEYTVIGNQVNLAARIEAYSLRGQVLVSEAIRSQAGERIETGCCNRVMIKGKSEQVPLYELKAVNWPQRIEVPPVEERNHPRICLDLPVVFRRVHDKQVLARQHQGRILDMSYGGMRALLPMALPPYSEVVITLMPDLASGGVTDLYAKVLRCIEDSNGYVSSLEFTATDSPGHLAVKQCVDQALWERQTC